MKKLSKSETHCYGIEVDDTGSMVMVERIDGKAMLPVCYQANSEGMTALKHTVAKPGESGRICIRSCGAAALGVALALIALPHLEILLIAPHALYPMHRTGGAPILATAEARAERLAFLAERMI
ncbi:MAG: hypothetical protein JWN13_6874 [Betaproteobacteria bacterium]|jgi:hypothetical protein|nr:hypothetical protein [Betaproteobacteria bacterium]